MVGGYDRALYVLPFDHRHSYGKEVFGYQDPMTAEQIEEVAHSKQVIYGGFKRAIEEGKVKREEGAILVDEEFGAAVQEDARAHGYIRALSVEKSGQEEFDFEYGEEFGEHIAKFDPAFVKVLVRFNVEGDGEMNRRQGERLRRLSEWLTGAGRRMMFELLVPAEKGQLAAVGGEKKRYDVEVRPGLMVKAVEALQGMGVEPDVWKIEGLDRRGDCERMVAAVRRGGRDKVGCIVLGRGENEEKVLEWLRVAAGVEGYIGFAVGRSSFLQAILDLRAGKIGRGEAVGRIAGKFEEWVECWRKAKGGNVAGS